MTRTTIPCGLAATAVAIGGYIHLVLYRRSYHAIAHVGVMFALDVVLAAGIATALLLRRDILSIAAALLHTIGALTGFVLSRTVGLSGFKETGLQPSPEAASALITETVALGFLVWAALVSQLSPSLRPIRSAGPPPV